MGVGTGAPEVGLGHPCSSWMSLGTLEHQGLGKSSQESEFHPSGTQAGDME